MTEVSIVTSNSANMNTSRRSGSLDSIKMIHKLFLVNGVQGRLDITSVCTVLLLVNKNAQP